MVRFCVLVNAMVASCRKAEGEGACKTSAVLCQFLFQIPCVCHGIDCFFFEICFPIDVGVAVGV